MDLTETGLCPAPKGLVSFSEVGMAPAYRNWFVDLCVNRFVGAFIIVAHDPCAFGCKSKEISFDQGIERGAANSV